ncbi:DEBR0S2_07184g1_1 [Brettanomyces bruxellensis]|uniref:Mediator of RNA polymerase II transcription subunit 5 n=2 Tax=Dekkera bruxellensis TaxID=5007 RepID=A0A7D9CWF7_DEKBR|nr:DEBR0S2_07184g1_1 [Brettanomyces bruxellensis]
MSETTTTLGQPQLDRLVLISLRKKFHPLTFGKLYREYKFKTLSGTNDAKIDLLPLFQDCSSSALQLKYIFEVLVTNDLDNTFEDLVNFFSTYLAKLKQEDQTAILVYFNQISDEFPWKSLGCHEEFLKALGSFLESFPKFQRSLDNDAKFILMLTKFVANILSSGSKIFPQFTQDILNYLEYLKKNGFDSSYEYLNASFSDYNLSAVKKGYNTLTVSQNGRQGSLESAKLLKIRKILWLSQQFIVKYSPVNEKLIRVFKRVLNLSSVTTAATNTSIAYEFTTSMFDCLLLSTKRTRDVWINAITNKLPLVMKLLKISQAKLATTLQNISDASNVDQNRQVFIKFLKNLITLDLVKPEHLQRIVTNAPSTLAMKNIKTEEVVATYNNIFHKSNPEFSSIEESGALNFMKTVSQSILYMQTVSKLILDSIRTFITEKDNLRLRRILISLASEKSVLDYVLLERSPYDFIQKLLSYLDQLVDTRPGTETKSDQFMRENNEDFMDLDLGSDDASNAQEFFTDLGTVLIFVQYAVYRYNMNLWKFEKNDITLQLLNNASTINSNDYLEKLQDPSSELNKIMNKWISSLFNSDNTDGISDDLIKMCSLRDYHFIMPRILEEAIMAYSSCLIDEDSLIGGLEYFYQPFLINNLTTIFRYLVNASWEKEGQNSIITLTKILEKLSKPGEMNDEARILHSMVMENVNDVVFTALENLSGLPQVENYLKQLKKPDPDSTDLSGLITYILEGKPAKFELPEVYMIADSIGERLDMFYDELTFILSTSTKDGGNSHVNNRLAEALDYELIASLMVYYSSFKTCTPLKSWVNHLNYFNEKRNLDIAYDRVPSNNLTITNSASTKLEEETASDSKENITGTHTGSSFDESLMGFVKDPEEAEQNNITVKLDPDAMIDDSKEENSLEKIEEKRDRGKNECDLFIVNLLILIRYNDPKVMNNLITRILSNLECIH